MDRKVLAAIAYDDAASVRGDRQEGAGRPVTRHGSSPTRNGDDGNGPPARAALCRAGHIDDRRPLHALKTETEAALAAAADLRAWDAVRVAVLGRNGS